MNTESTKSNVYFPCPEKPRNAYWDPKQLDVMNQLFNIVTPKDYNSPWTNVPDSVDAIILGWGVDGLLPKSVWSNLPRLKVMSVFGGSTAGIENATEALERGITLTNASREIGEGVAEETLGLILASQYVLVTAAGQYRSTGEIIVDHYHRSHSISGSTVGIIGFGYVGRQVASLLKPFSVDLLVSDPMVDKTFIHEHGGAKVELEELLSRSDIVCVHAGLNDQTQGMLGAGELDLLKEDALVVSTARMRLFDQESLAERIKQGRLRFASDFVPFDEDVWSDPAIHQCQNLIAVPGHTSITHRTFKLVSERIVLDLQSALANKTVVNNVTASWIKHTT